MTVPPLRELVHTMLLTVQEADVISDLRANEVVVVACPPGSRVVVDRTAKTCPCKMNQNCPVCGGSGVVEATTTYGLAPFVLGNPGTAYLLVDPDSRVINGVRVGIDHALPGGPPAVALPEETPQ